MFSGKPYDVTLTATSSGVAVPFTRKALMDFLSAHPEEGVDVLYAIALLTVWSLVVVEHKR
jgi:hypothetical protein